MNINTIRSFAELVRHLILLLLLVAGCVTTNKLTAKEQSPELTIRGIEGEAAENIQRSIDLSRYQCSDSDWQLTRLKSRVQKQGIAALQALGYYNSRLELRFVRKDDCWRMELDVVAGERVVVSELTISIQGELKDLPAMQKFLADPPLKKSRPLNHDDYKNTKTEIEVLAARFGFFSGRFSRQRFDIDKANNRAYIELVYEAGPRASIAEIKIQDETYRGNFLQQFIILEQGMPYDSQQLIRQQQILSGSGYFSQVDVEAIKPEQDPQQVDINIVLQPVKKHAYRIGIGASTDVGPRLSFDYDNRRVNRRGHEFSLDSSVSPVRNEITTDYGIPQGNAGADRLDFQIGYLQEDSDTSDLESYKLAALKTRLNRHDWVTTWFLEYLYEDFITADTTRLSKLLMPGYKLQKTVVKNNIFPRKGWRANASLRLASEDLLSSTNLARLESGFKFVVPASKARLLVRTDIGASVVDDFSKLPPSLRFFAGGDASVRGFDYKSLGPENDAGEVIGGKFLLTSSIEYEYPLKKQWGLAAFVDTGNAFDDFDDYELETGVGIGIRWHSPIGPIRLDLAQDVTGERSPRLHLSMGLDL